MRKTSISTRHSMMIIFGTFTGILRACGDGTDSNNAISSAYGEIFGMYAIGAQSAHSLLSVTLANMFAKAPSIQEVIYFIEDHEQIAHQAALNNGFRKTSRYELWVK